MNSINVIIPYKENGVWRFNDSLKELTGEPFVGETNKIIDQMINDSLYVNNEEKVVFYFADRDFPGAEFVLNKTIYELGGAWYKWGNSEDALEGWLCSATLKYFERFPEKIYISLFTDRRK